MDKSNLNKIIKNTLSIYAKIIFNIIVSFYTTRVVLNSLGQDDYGIWALIGGLVAFFSIIYSSMTTASMRYMSFAIGKGDFTQTQKTFAISFLLHSLIAILFVLLIQLIGSLMFNYALLIPINKLSEAWIVFQFTVAITFLYIISVPFEAVINSHENIFILSIFDSIATFLRLISVILITFLTQDLLGIGKGFRIEI